MSSATPGTRKTRSGAEFSPYVVGPPIVAPENFELRKCMEAALTRMKEHSSRAAADDPDDPDLVSPGEQMPEPSESMSHLFAHVITPSNSRPETLDKVKKAQSHTSHHSHKRRRAKRAAEAQKIGLSASLSLKKVAVKRLREAQTLYSEVDVARAMVADTGTPMDVAAPLETALSFEMDDVHVASTGFIGDLLPQSDEDKRAISVQELREREGWEYVPWDGKTIRVLLSKDGFAFGELAGQPRDWEDMNATMMKIFAIVAESYTFKPGDLESRRGKFPSVACGISYGGGQKRPGNLAHNAHNRALWEAILDLTPIRRVANFANHALKKCFPDVYEFYEATMAGLCENDPDLKRNYLDNVFAALSLNLGPRAISYVHTDHLNLAFGLCAITAFGDYDPVKGGHLILWDIQKIIEFPPGSTILIPSAILRHSNAALAGRDERRYALVQYSAGGLFRWAECGFQSQKSFFAAGRKFLQTGRQRWERGVAMFSKWSQLKERLGA